MTTERSYWDRLDEMADEMAARIGASAATWQLLAAAHRLAGRSGVPAQTVGGDAADLLVALAIEQGRKGGAA